MDTYGHIEEMKEAMISELKSQLSRYLDFVRRGETVLVRDRKTPVARLVPVTGEKERLRLERATARPDELEGILPVRLLKRVDPVKRLREERDAR